MKLELTDGSFIDNITRINPSTFRVEGDTSLYFRLINENLVFATLYNDEGGIENIFINTIRQNFFCDKGTVEFRLREVEVEDG